MNIGIITLVSVNYGNKFQNYAVEMLLKEYGDVETFAVAEEFFLQQNVSGPWQKLKKISPYYIKQVLRSRMMYQYDITDISKPILVSLLYVLKNKEKLRQLQEERKRKFLDYQNEHLHISDRVITSKNCTEEEWLNKYDYFFCGSDQIWNPSYRTTSSLAFLSFAKKGAAVAIAPSFGVATIPEERRNNFAQWINHIDYLSVREVAGQKIIKELTGRHADVLLDPTMAIPVEQWKQLAKKTDCKLPPKYILCYFLGCVDKEYKKRIKEYSKKMGLPVVSLFNIEEPEVYILDPNEVLYVIKNASVVVTDSFHGTVFSILFHKNFVVWERNEGGASMSSRISTLLEKFGLEERKNLLADDFGNVEESKWDVIDSVLVEECDKTIRYIEDALRNSRQREKIKQE